MSLAAAAALVAGCGQEGPMVAAPAAEPRAVTAVVSPTAKVLAQSDFCDDALAPTCTPTGAHGKIAVGFQPVHAGYDCKVCHYVGGRLAFQPGGPAFLTAPGSARPSFDATAKTCSNIACHTVPPGQFSYYFPGNEMDEEGYPIPELKTVNYGGGVGSGPTPSWYSTGQGGCTSCHGNPPANGSDGSNAWHSGNHANDQNIGPVGPNDCELCHNQLVLPSTYNPLVEDTCEPVSMACAGTAILIPALHGDGQLSINARFRTQCFGCH